MFKCVMCDESLEKAEFSKNQLCKKKEDKTKYPRCNKCITINSIQSVPTQEFVSSLNMEIESESESKHPPEPEPEQKQELVLIEPKPLRCIYV